MIRPTFGWCLFGLHKGPWTADESTVVWIGGAAGARPFNPTSRSCERCGTVQHSVTRAAGPGLIP